MACLRAPPENGHLASVDKSFLSGTIAPTAVPSFFSSMGFLLSSVFCLLTSCLTGSVPRSALRAEPPENELAFAKNPLTEEARGRPGHVVVLNVLNIAAAVADEVVMRHACRIESRGAALHGYFTHQTRLHQVPQIVISRGPGRTRIHAIHAFEDFRRRGMPVMFHQECHHGVALRSASQPAAFHGTFNRPS